MRTPYGRRRSAGFTFVEVVFAMALFSVGLLAITAMFGMAWRVLIQGGQQFQGMSLAQDKMEALGAISNDYDQLLLAGAGEEDLGHVPGNSGRIKRRWRVAETVGLPGLALITVEVEWKDHRGNLRVTRLVNAKSRP